MLIDYFVNQ